MKTLEMKEGVTYILCPDKKCGLFNSGRGALPCIGECPKKEKIKFFILCINCKEVIELSGDWSRCMAVRHNCRDGKYPLFNHPNNYWQLYERPIINKKTGVKKIIIAGKIGNLKKSELEVGATYIICPDRKCKNFFNTSSPLICDGKCPKKKKLKFIIVCHNCKGLVELPGHHHIWQRIDHLCPNGMCCANFRMSGKYHILYKKPRC